jgi:predicted Zn-dependent peptidase
MINSRKKTLHNGLRVVAVEMPHLHCVEIAVYIKVGGRDDPDDKAGLSHFLEHMLFRGTREFPSNLELETAFEAIGGCVNATTDEESTCYFSRVHPDHVAEGVELFASMLLRPTLKGIDIEKRIISEEALEDINEQGEETNPHNLSSRLLWPGHPLGKPTIGYLDTIKSFAVEDLKTHLDSFYAPSNAVLVLAGDIKAETAFAAASKAFGEWRGNASLPLLPAPSQQSRPQSLFVKDSDSQVHLLIAFRGFPRSDPRITAGRLIRRILCGGGSSRLHLRLREELGVVYSVDASISAYEETGSFAIELSVLRENLALSIREVLNETMRLAKEPIPDTELARVKKCYIYDLEYGRDSAYEMQARYGWGELMGICRSIEEDRAEAENVNAEGIRSAAGTLFAPHNLNLVSVGPWKNAERRETEGILKRYMKEFQGKAPISAVSTRDVSPGTSLPNPLHRPE